MATTQLRDPFDCVKGITPGSIERFQLYFEGDDLYEAMLATIGRSRSSVRLETYIFASDEVGWRFCDALVRKAEEGVSVRLIIDAAGSLFWTSRRVTRALHHPNIQVKWFHRWSWRNPLRYNLRDHRKLLVVDKEQAFLGGFNIHKENSRSVYGDQRWLDAHVCVEGQLAVEAAKQFDAVWSRRRNFSFSESTPTHGMLVSNIFRNCRKQFRHLYWERIKEAERSILIANSYFAPDRHTLRRLMTAARRGVEVRLILPRKSDVPAVQWAARAVYAAMLEAGIRVYEFCPRPLHAKYAVMDDHWSMIGSANLDYRSLRLNYELNLVARDPELARQLKSHFYDTLSDCEQITAEKWKSRPRLGRLCELVGHQLQRYL